MFQMCKNLCTKLWKKNSHIKASIVGRLKKKRMQWKKANPTIPLNILLADKEEKGTK